jgi:hypothetical protein
MEMQNNRDFPLSPKTVDSNKQNCGAMVVQFDKKKNANR